MKKLLVILYFIPIIAFNQTRLYGRNSFTPFGNSSNDMAAPTPSTGQWTSTGSSLVRLAVSPRISGSAETVALAIDVSSSTASSLMAQYVTAPLAKQTISGNFKGQIRAQISSTSSTTVSIAVAVFVVNPAGTIVATLLNRTVNATALTTTATNRQVPVSSALSSYSCNTGDRIVIEMGGVRSVGTAARTLSMFMKNSQGTDLSEDDTSVTSNDSWWEFSNTLIFNKGIPPNF